MFRFTIRNLVEVTTIVGIACFYGSGAGEDRIPLSIGCGVVSAIAYTLGVVAGRTESNT